MLCKHIQACCMWRDANPCLCASEQRSSNNYTIKQGLSNRGDPLLTLAHPPHADSFPWCLCSPLIANNHSLGAETPSFQFACRETKVCSSTPWIGLLTLQAPVAGWGDTWVVVWNKRNCKLVIGGNRFA